MPLTFLPAEIAVFGERLVNPFRGIAFEELDGFEMESVAGIETSA